MEKITAEMMHESYDWVEAWHQGDPVTVCEGADIVKCSSKFVVASDVEEVIAAEEGENDQEDWVAVVKLKDGRYAFVEAGCDYTGWDCQAGGQVWVSDSLENLWQFGVTDNARARIGDGT